ncbi:MAG: glycoside hydrolase family 2 TIM barrel-domain containing protein [Candidatus Poribacteria bacterium]
MNIENLSKTKAIMALTLLCFFFCSFSAMAKDNEIPDIESISLNGVWKFKADPNNVGINEKWNSKDIDVSSWENIGVPGTWNEGQKVTIPVWNYEGVGWYRRVIEPQKNWSGENIRLKFMAVYLIADVWLNDTYLGNHKGGYTAFTFDVSKVLDFSKPNILIVKADNTKRQYQIPGVSIDWWNCGGITRDVFLEKLPKVYLKKLFIKTPEVNPQNSTVKAEISLEGDPEFLKNIKIKSDVFYKGKLIASSTGNNPSFIIKKANLWSLDSPSLYELKVSWNISGKSVTHHEKFGIRRIEVKGTELYLNGKKIWLQGVAIHQDYSGMGSAVTYKAIRSDLERIKKLNANFVRLGHYPFDQRYAEVCDEIGLLAWSEIPVWQNSREELANEQMWNEWVKPQLDDMINQYYNHPSIIFWSVANEISQVWGGEKEHPEIINYIKKSTDYVRSLDNTRLISYASAASTGGGTWEYLDVNAKPLHYGWFHSPNVYDIGPEVDKVHSKMPNQPIFGIELCGMSYPDNHKGYSQDERFSVEYHDKLLREDMQQLMIRKDFVCGVTLWTLADLKGGREQGTYGILDRERNQVKHIYETVKNLYSKDPKLLIIDSKTSYKHGEKMEVDLWTFNRLETGVKGCKVHWWINGKDGKLADGYFATDIAPDSTKKIGTVSWQIPDNASGFHSLLCTMTDSKGNLLFINDYYFDVDKPEAPGILWVKVVDKDNKPLSDATVEIGGFTRITDEFGRVPFLLHTGKYKVTATSKGKMQETEAEAEIGKTSEITMKF